MSKKNIISGTILILGLAISMQTAGAFGVSPALIELDGVLAGTRVEREMTITRPPYDPPGIAKISVTEGMDYIVLGQESIELQANQGQTKVPIVIDATNLKPGNYEAKIQYVYEVQNADQFTGAGSEIHRGVISRVKFSVTSESVEKWTVKQAFLEYENKKYPITLKYTLDNDGNIPVKPDLITLKIKNDLKSYEVNMKSKELEETAPFSEVGHSVTVPLKPKAGIYEAEIYLFDNKGEEIFKNSQPIQVLQKDVKTRNIVLIAGLSILTAVAIYWLSVALRSRSRARR